MHCPICEKRKANRFCPAKSETICAVCCGTEREVTIDCPADCPHLISARRYEQEHRETPRAEDIPFPDVEIPRELIQERRAVVSGLGFTVLKYAKEDSSLVDSDVIEAAQALAEAYRTLGSGIYYEKPPAGVTAQGMYAALAEYLNEYKKSEAERAGFSTVKDAELFRLLVFFLRVGKYHANARRRSRAFLDFLRAQYPTSPEITKETPRIVMP